MKKFFLYIGVAIIIVFIYFIVACITHFDPLQYLSNHLGIFGVFLWFIAVGLLSILISKWIRKSKNHS